MNFVMASSSFLQAPLYQSLTPPPYSSSSFFCSNTKNAELKKKKKNKNISSVATASLPPENPNEARFCRRRAIFLLAISSFSFLHSRARAVDALMTEEKSIRMPGGEGLQTPKNLQKEKLSEREVQPNPFVVLLNAIGIIGSGVLGALYVLAQKEKEAVEGTIESINARLSRKEAAMDSLQNSTERMLLNEQEERTKQIRKAKEEQQSLLDELGSTNSTLKSLQKELQSEKRLVKDFKDQMDRLQTDLRKAAEDKMLLEANLKEKLRSIEVLQERINLVSVEMKRKEDTIRNYSSSLAEKEMEYKNLDSICKQANADLAESSVEMIAVKDQLFRTQRELDLKNSAMDDLNARISSLIAERDEKKRKIDALQKDYNNLKLSSEKKAALDAELLLKREQELRQHKEKLELAFNEASNFQASIINLTQERDELKKFVEIKVSNIKNLMHELQITHETLGVSRAEILDLLKELTHSRKLREELSSDVSKVRAEFTKAQESLKKSLDEAKSTAEVLSSELASAKALLKKTEEDLQSMSSELAAVTDSRDNLKKELVDVYRKAESAAHDLKEEKQKSALLKRELEASGKRIFKDKEGRKALEMGLEEATKSLNEMNRNSLILSRDLEMTNSRIANLGDENDILYKSFVEQKCISQEAQENVQDAHNLLMKLGKERESFEKRAKKLEEELACAKGEILRLRSQINSRTVLNDQHQEKSTGCNAAVTVNEQHQEKSIGRDVAVAVNDKHPEKSTSSDAAVAVKDQHQENTDHDSAIAVNDQHQKKNTDFDVAVAVNDKHLEKNTGNDAVNDQHQERNSDCDAAVAVNDKHLEKNTCNDAVNDQHQEKNTDCDAAVAVNDKHPEKSVGSDAAVAVNDLHQEKNTDRDAVVAVNDKHLEASIGSDAAAVVNDQYQENTDCDAVVAVNDKHPEKSTGSDAAVTINDQHQEKNTNCDAAVAVNDKHSEKSTGSDAAVAVNDQHREKNTDRDAAVAINDKHQEKSTGRDAAVTLYDQNQEEIKDINAAVAETEQHQEKRTNHNAAVSVKRNTRRRKGGAQPDASS